MASLQRFVFQGLVHKPFSLTGQEIRFMRKFLELSTTELGEKLGVSHATIVKWENEQVKIAPMQEAYIRLFLCESFRNSEFIRLFKEIRPETLAKAKQKKRIPFPVNAKELEATNF
jgi:DNA-binding XRE family transcriptional regulator